VFIIENARLSTDAKTAEGKKYVVVMTDAAGLRNQLNRQVTITGMADKTAVAVTTPPAGTPDAGQPSVRVEERDLPKFSAKTIVRVADVCTT
jgi:fibronectin type 3 domain-containing protein